jgi:hypothetical protein
MEKKREVLDKSIMSCQLELTNSVLPVHINESTLIFLFFWTSNNCKPYSYFGFQDF